MYLYARSWKNMFTMTGRATRTEFWLFVGVTWLILKFLNVVVHTTSTRGIREVVEMIDDLAWLAGTTLFVRRLHDVDRRAWWILIPIIPAWYAVKAGTHGPNRFEDEAESLRSQWIRMPCAWLALTGLTLSWSAFALDASMLYFPFIVPDREWLRDVISALLRVGLVLQTCYLVRVRLILKERSIFGGVALHGIPLSILALSLLSTVAGAFSE